MVVLQMFSDPVLSATGATLRRIFATGNNSLRRNVRLLTQLVLIGRSGEPRRGECRPNELGIVATDLEISKVTKRGIT
jgi:hypothetical protein